MSTFSTNRVISSILALSLAVITTTAPVFALSGGNRNLVRFNQTSLVEGDHLELVADEEVLLTELQLESTPGTITVESVMYGCLGTGLDTAGAEFKLLKNDVNNQSTTYGPGFLSDSILGTAITFPVNGFSLNTGEKLVVEASFANLNRTPLELSCGFLALTIKDLNNDLIPATNMLGNFGLVTNPLNITSPIEYKEPVLQNVTVNNVYPGSTNATVVAEFKANNRMQLRTAGIMFNYGNKQAPDENKAHFFWRLSPSGNEVTGLNDQWYQNNVTLKEVVKTFDRTTQNLTVEYKLDIAENFQEFTENTLHIHYGWKNAATNEAETVETWQQKDSFSSETPELDVAYNQPVLQNVTVNNVYPGSTNATVVAEFKANNFMQLRTAGIMFNYGNKQAPDENKAHFFWRLSPSGNEVTGLNNQWYQNNITLKEVVKTFDRATNSLTVEYKLDIAENFQEFAANKLHIHYGWKNAATNQAETVPSWQQEGTFSSETPELDVA